MTDLSGSWLAFPADEALLRSFTDPAFADDDWEPLSVPGHWRSAPAFAEFDGPLLYRSRFSSPSAPADNGSKAPDETRWWLVFDGVFYQADIWLDDTYVGDAEGYFFPHGFDVTDQLAARREHTLAVEVGCAPQTDRSSKRNLTGIFQHWDCLDADWNPGGIWRPVRLEHSGPIRIRHFRALCTEASAESATVFVRAVLDSSDSGSADLVTRVARTEVVESRPLAAGENRVEWTVTIPDPDLWWPRNLGDQPLHELTVEARLPDGRVSDLRTRTIGFRSVQLDNFVFRINGERFFVKGSNHGPARMALGDATADELSQDVALAQSANLDMLRVHAHITRPEFYEAADKAGLLVWQDLPLQWGYSRGVRKQARRQAREAVDLLAHHPSVVLWCGHNEPMAIDADPTKLDDPRQMRRIARRFVGGQMLPSWNKTVLDHSIRRVLERNDPSRPVIPHSGVLPHPPQLDGTDTHLYFGWYHGREHDLSDFLRRWPRAARFVSEFGAQAVPDDADFCDPDAWPDLDWEHLARRHALQKARFDVYVPPAAYASFGEWSDATQAYQARLIKHQVEALRRIKYRPTGGFLQFCFADGHPAVTWSVLDHQRRPKPALDALRRACDPVIVVADHLPEQLRAGQRLALDVHVVSDLRTPLREGTVHARLSWDGELASYTWTGDVAADSCVHIGTVESAVPDAPGALALDLEFRCGDVRATNRYEALIPV